ncbi:MAG: sigma-70 family RNA polymerase sigma factor [Spirochaetes bacterium]|nr:sigma-70 family RNA polymerase sigma factor [Spirochaetota bacterium]
MDFDLAAWYERYAPMVLRRCRYLLGNEDEAADAMQEVFMKVLDNRERLTGKYPSSLLFTIATNICLNILRHRRRHPSVFDNDAINAIAAADDVSGAVEAGDMLARIFADEQEMTRTMAVMYYVDGMTYKEIGRETGLSISGVRKRLLDLGKRARAVAKGAGNEKA